MFTEEQISVFVITISALIFIAYFHFVYLQKLHNEPNVQPTPPTTPTPPPSPPSVTSTKSLSPQDHAQLRRRHLNLVIQNMDSSRHEVDLYFLAADLREARAQAEQAERQREIIAAQTLARRFNGIPTITEAGGWNWAEIHEVENIPPSLNDFPSNLQRRGRRRRVPLSENINLSNIPPGQW